MTCLRFRSGQYFIKHRASKVTRVPRRSSVGTMITACICFVTIQRVSSGAHRLSAVELDDMLADFLGLFRCQTLRAPLIQNMQFAVNVSHRSGES